MKPTGTWRVGIDLVQVSRIAESLEQFGDRFVRRVFTDGEIGYAASSPASAPERFAARFAATRAGRGMVLGGGSLRLAPY
mgnify:CR=1 FL=1